MYGIAPGQAWVVASELARGHGFVLAKNTLLVLTVASTVGKAFAQNVSSGVVSNGVVSSGETQVVYSNGQTSNATVNSGKITSTMEGKPPLQQLIVRELRTLGTQELQ